CRIRYAPPITLYRVNCYRHTQWQGRTRRRPFADDHSHVPHATRQHLGLSHRGDSSPSSLSGSHVITAQSPEGLNCYRKFNIWPVGYEVAETKPPQPNQTEPLDLNEAVAALQRAAATRSGQVVVVIDEFDRIVNDRERTHFADFIKQIGDRRLEVRFVFCGVAASLEKLLGMHESCYRYITAIELPRLSWDARWAIIDAAAAALAISIGAHPRFRIAAISDGFPHYIHLIGEKLFWEMFNDPHVCIAPTVQHYSNAVASAVIGIEQHLKRAYEKATLKDSSDFEEVLWAVADHSELIRHVDSIYDSYETIAKRLAIAEPLDRARFGSCLRSLRSASCGGILASSRRGWYQFRENIVRGYVRLRAEEQGLELALDYQGAEGESSGWRQRGLRARSRRAGRHYRSKG
ncbi:MAG: hypothetical protein ABJA98_31985, partial [Acidobacteriota bacterium]